MTKNRAIGCVSVLLAFLMLAGCVKQTKTEYETADEIPMLMTVVDKTSGYTIYRHDETGVHYFCRMTGYGASVCVMVKPDGTPYIGE